MKSHNPAKGASGHSHVKQRQACLLAFLNLSFLPFVFSHTKSEKYFPINCGTEIQVMCYESIKTKIYPWDSKKLNPTKLRNTFKKLL